MSDQPKRKDAEAALRALREGLEQKIAEWRNSHETHGDHHGFWHAGRTDCADELHALLEATHGTK